MVDLYRLLMLLTLQEESVLYSEAMWCQQRNADLCVQLYVTFLFKNFAWHMLREERMC